ncbi:MAG: RNHCP domain-containing protein [Thermomicrobiales bacterium]
MTDFPDIPGDDPWADDDRPARERIGEPSRRDPANPPRRASQYPEASRDWDDAFRCIHCELLVFPLDDGGERDHCPRCLWSFHTESDPDLPACGMPMEPILLIGDEAIRFRCTSCGVDHDRPAAPDDRPSALRALPRLDA